MFRRYYGVILCGLMMVMITACNLPSKSSDDSLTLTSIANEDVERANQNIIEPEETEVIEIIETQEIDNTSIIQEQPASDTTSNTTIANNTIQTCIPRTDWLAYRVVSGDTLGQIASRTGSTITALMEANCLDNANLLTIGQQIVVPQQPTNITEPSSNTISNTCQITASQRVEVVNAPQGTGRTILGYLEAGTSAEAIIHFEGLPYYGIRYNDMIGWVNIQPTGDCSNLASTPDEINAIMGNNNNSNADCIYNPTQSTSLYVYPGTSYAVVATLNTGINYEVTAKSPNGWYQMQFNPQGAKGWAQIQPSGNCASLEEQIFDCQFVGDTVMPIYKNPEIGSEQLGTLNAGDVYRFGEFAGEWTSGDVSGYWIGVFYTVQRPIAGYIQNTGGHLEGACPTR